MKNKLLILMFLVSSFYQISMGNEKNMIDQQYKEIKDLNNIYFKNKYLEMFGDRDIRNSRDVYILAVSISLKSDREIEWKTIKGSLDITKDNKILRTVNFDFSNDDPINIINYDGYAELETRVLLIDGELKVYANLGNENLKDIVINPRIFVRNSNCDAYFAEFSTSIFPLYIIDHTLRYALGLPLTNLHSLNPSEYSIRKIN